MMNLSQTKLVGLTMELDLRTREYKKLCEKLDNLKADGINPNDESFLAPDNMIEAIKNYLGKPELPIGDVLNSVYHSLAKTYNEAVKVVEEISNKQIDVINIVGGGCKDMYLNSLTEKYTGKKVIAGPVEATAAGNLMVQLMYLDKGLNLTTARELIKNSFGKN